MEQAIDIGKTSDPMPVLMDAAALAAKTAGGRGDPTAFVVHQMSAHPELVPRLKDFIVDPPPRMSFSSYLCSNMHPVPFWVSLLSEKEATLNFSAKKSIFSCINQRT